MKKLTFLLLATSTLFWTSCGEEEEKKEKEYDPFVHAEEVQQQEFSHYFEALGTVEADKNVMLTSEMAGVVRGISVEEGQEVKANQILVVLDNVLIAKNIQEVQKSKELADYMLKKTQELFDQSLASEPELKQAQNQVDALAQKLLTLRAQAGKYIVSAPFAGHVEKVFPKVGEMASPGMPVVQLVSLGNVDVVGNVSENYLPQVKVGSLVDVEIKALGKTWKNVPVSSVGRSINVVNRTFRLEVAIADSTESILPNLSAVLKIKNYNNPNALVVPNASVLRDEHGGAYVYKLKPGEKEKFKAIKVPVKVAPYSSEGMYEISGGDIKRGDLVATKGVRGLEPDQEIKVITQ
jgi:membrane fusion protein (multidrug efflux system)